MIKKNETNRLIELIIDGHNSDSVSFVDVGARWGVQRPWNVFPEKCLSYFGIDADKDECERLNNNETNKNLHYFFAALSDNESNEILYLTKEEGRSSIYKPNKMYLDKFYDNIE